MRDGGERRGVRGLPEDPEGAAALRAWVARPGSLLDVAELDLSSADLSGADFGTGMLAGAVLRDAVLIGTDFYRCHMEGAVLEGADLTRASLVKAVLDGASLRGAVLNGADLGGAELYDVDLRDASLRGARLDGASLGGARMQGADFSGASMRETAFAVLVDERTVVRGLAGSAYGPMTVDSGGRVREVGGRAMEVWLSGRGADVRVIDPAFPDVTYYAKIDERHPRPAPRGVVRRRVLDGPPTTRPSPGTCAGSRPSTSGSICSATTRSTMWRSPRARPTPSSPPLSPGSASARESRRREPT